VQRWEKWRWHNSAEALEIIANGPARAEGFGASLPYNALPVEVAALGISIRPPRDNSRIVAIRKLRSFWR
jgi:hypothetical protein